ncbi:hypothetical protein WJ968_31670 [Achromobacter xylosoxidans]
MVDPGKLLDAARAALAAGKVDPVAPWDKKGYRLPGGDAYTPSNAAALAAANASVQAASRGNYPAPLTILRTVYEGSKLPIDKALRLEQKLFVTLVRGRPAQNLIRTMFFARQAADKLARLGGGCTEQGWQTGHPGLGLHGRGDRPGVGAGGDRRRAARPHAGDRPGQPRRDRQGPAGRSGQGAPGRRGARTGAAAHRRCR